MADTPASRTALMSDTELTAMLEEAADRGASRALERLGLHDTEAGNDIRDLRILIDGWREAKTTIAKAVLQWFTIGVLGLLTLGMWMQLGGKK